MGLWGVGPCPCVQLTCSRPGVDGQTDYTVELGRGPLRRSLPSSARLPLMPQVNAKAPGRAPGHGLRRNLGSWGVGTLLVCSGCRQVCAKIPLLLLFTCTASWYVAFCLVRGNTCCTLQLQSEIFVPIPSHPNEIRRLDMHRPICFFSASN